MTTTDNGEDKEQEQEMTVNSFLESCPPNRVSEISPLTHYSRQDGGNFLCTPEIQLYCDNESCRGTRFFKCNDQIKLLPTKRPQHRFLNYYCKNCQKNLKTFAVVVYLNEDETSGSLMKFGERPTFGPPTPSRVIKLIGPDRDFFLTGRRAENHGMGIGAFVYYRRVVENQKNRILDEIIRVSEKLDATVESLQSLQSAKAETQFSKAVDSVKNAIPQSLLINGHNPLTLLHSALSEGLHAQTDEQCLELATSIRVVLNELAERLGQALKDEAELNTAVSRLLNSKNGPQKAS